jgi:hypothetical protein
MGNLKKRYALMLGGMSYDFHEGDFENLHFIVDFYKENPISTAFTVLNEDSYASQYVHLRPSTHDLLKLSDLIADCVFEETDSNFISEELLNSMNFTDIFNCFNHQRMRIKQYYTEDDDSISLSFQNEHRLTVIEFTNDMYSFKVVDLYDGIQELLAQSLEDDLEHDEQSFICDVNNITSRQEYLLTRIDYSLERVGINVKTN